MYLGNSNSNNKLFAKEILLVKAIKGNKIIIKNKVYYFFFKFSKIKKIKKIPIIKRKIPPIPK